MSNPPLPHPGPRPDATSDDNLAETARLTLWNAIGRPELAIDVVADRGVVTLSGCLGDEASCRLAEVAVARVPGVREVINALETKRPAPHAPSPARRGRQARSRHVASEPMLSVTRYCGFTEASLSAAIRGAIDELDRAAAAQTLEAMRSLILIYRNLNVGSVTLEIGMPAPAGAVATGELRLGTTPTGLMLRANAPAGIDGLYEAHHKLVATAEASRSKPGPYFWQRFESDAFRPWAGHPAAEVFLPVECAETSPLVA